MGWLFSVSKLLSGCAVNLPGGILPQDFASRPIY
jgi:hypothetical protein